jgi:hypothetical protein
MSFLSNRFRKKSDGLPPWAARDQEALRIAAAMEHLQDHGNLDSFPGSQNEKLALMITARRQGLVRWNRTTRRYELSRLARERSGTRRTSRETEGSKNPSPAFASLGKGSTLGPGTIMAGILGVAIGAAAMALLPGSFSKQLPREQAAVATATKPSGAGDDGKPSDAGHAPAGTQAQTQAAVPPQEHVAQDAPAATPAASPTAEAQQPAAREGAAGEIGGALAQQLAVAPAEPAPTSTTAGGDAKEKNQTATSQAKPLPAPASVPTPENATSQPATATSALPPTADAKPAAEPEQQPPSTERAGTHEAAPANPEQPSYAQSTGGASAPGAGETSARTTGEMWARTAGETSGRSASNPSRSRPAATKERQSASESKQKSRHLFDWLFR